MLRHLWSFLTIFVVDYSVRLETLLLKVVHCAKCNTDHLSGDCANFDSTNVVLCDWVENFSKRINCMYITEVVIRIVENEFSAYLNHERVNTRHV